MSAQGYVMVVEDNDEDMEAIDRIIARCFPGLRVQRATDGSSVVPLLKANIDLLPRVVLLDLNLVGLTGRQILALIRADPELSALPVVVLTSCTDSAEVDACYAAGASGYLFKSIDFALLQQTLDAGLQYWLMTDAVQE